MEFIGLKSVEIRVIRSIDCIGEYVHVVKNDRLYEIDKLRHKSTSA